MTSPLGFKSSMGIFIHAWQMRTCYTFSQIKFLPTANELSECNCHYVQEERGSYVSITHDTLNLTQAPPPPPRLAPLWPREPTVERDSSLVTSDGHHWRLGHFILSLDS